jgi:excisionase family DNA binding protein
VERNEDARRTAFNLDVNVSAAPRLLSIPDAAKYMACTVWFLKCLIASKRLAYLKIGNRIRVDRCDLDRFIESQRTLDDSRSSG